MLMELPALLLIPVVVLRSPDPLNALALVPLAFWMVHYSYRRFIYPALMRPSINTFPVQIVAYAVMFNLLNGYNNGLALNSNSASGV